MKACDVCNGKGAVSEVARYRVPPPGVAVLERDYRHARGSVLVDEVRVRPCIKCGGRGEVPGHADAA